MQSPENPEEEKSTAPIDSRPIDYGILLGLAAILAGLAIWMGKTGNGTGAVFSGVGAVSAFCFAQIRANRPLLAGIGASLAGAGVGAFLTFFNEQALSSCSQSTFANCGKVTGSDWGTLFDLPTALFACAFYAALALTLILSRAKDKTGAGATLLLFAGVGATTFSAFLAYQSKVVLDEWCTFCISLYAVAILCLVSGFIACKQTRPDTLPDALFKNGKAATGPALVLFLAIVGYGASTQSDGHDHAGGDHSGDNLDELYTLVDAPLNLTGAEPAKGSVKAEWTLVEFTDYSCPHCAEQAPAIQALIKSHPRAKLLHKHYAFLGEASILAAHAATCAHQQDRFWQMNQVLFDNMKEWTLDELVWTAKEMETLKLDEEAFSTCMQNPATAQSVEADYDVGDKAGVMATPSLFLSFDGKTWLKMTAGPEGASMLLAAAENGETLPGFSPGTPEKAAE
jgi:protein-disulfide isomerase